MKDPELKAWLEGKAVPPPEQNDPSVSDAVTQWGAALHSRVSALVAAFPRIPSELANAANVVSREVNAGQPGLVIGILVVLIAIGFGAEWLVRQALDHARKPVDDAAAGTALPDLICLLTFALASVGAFLAFDWMPLLRRIVVTLLVAFIAFRAVRIIARWIIPLTANGATPDQVAPMGTGGSALSFWLPRTSQIAGIFLFGWAVVSLMPALGFSNEVRALTAFLFGLAILAMAIEVVWRRPDRPASLVRRMLLTLCLVVLWLVWVAGLLGLLWLGILALVLPTAVRGAGNIAQALARRTRRAGAVGVILGVLIERGARAAVIAAAVAWLAYIWSIMAARVAGSAAAAIAVPGVLNAVVILLVADFLWQLSKRLIDYQLDLAGQAGGTAEEAARRARLRTLLPIFRNALAAFIAVVAVLTILSGLGVQVGPLIAGAGVFGVAVGFGSQTLVKDVLSGVFYMLDDAFRVGEYIQSGSYKGTVESFSLRSVRLRHHRGPVFTVPFGALGAVQNMSRDWVIEKMTIRLTYDSDVDLARKLIKKIGQDLAADPEFAADTIQPLKLQGIDNFGDFAIELKMKLMTKPGAQFSIKRRALMMIKKAFAENGIKIARPTVHVEGGASDAAAAAQQMIQMKEAADPAANQA
ncbi:mechanosensitive ion channel family protein [Rhizobium tropici]|uniref:Mechanosensitive ion channel family protein n=2 Tax=Rhizobium tropici TaxID=398 RepID=A0A5B0VRI0_RHITR|nr:mechanosensitive ion channel family protein [Rhizobium tropici]KAA1177300.1 mechanosensitive ion channel family protein [Rhizobium tropici]